MVQWTKLKGSVFITNKRKAREHIYFNYSREKGERYDCSLKTWGWLGRAANVHKARGDDGKLDNHTADP